MRSHNKTVSQRTKRSEDCGGQSQTKLLRRMRAGFSSSNTLIESLESRLLLSGSVLDQMVVTPRLDVQTQASFANIGGLTPDQVRQAYGINQIHFTDAKGNDIVGDGTGQTIAIVSAFINPQIANDLKMFDAQFGLPDTDGQGNFVLTTVNLGRIKGDATWSLETSLDVQWAHAVAPGAHILLVNSRSDNLSDMFAAVNFAKNQPGVSTVSMSWGTDEFYGEWTYDSYFTSPRVQGKSRQTPGVTFIAASGDNGAPGSYPAMASEVLAVGGTKLNIDAQGLYLSETGWSESGGGTSYFLAQPTYQQNAITSFSRTTPDVSYAGDPASGFPVYCSTFQSGGWIEVGGTSAGTPQWAGLIAIADQGRAIAGHAPLDGATQTLPAIYNMDAGSFHDVTVGYNGFQASAGYDLVTGRGSPQADVLTQNLLNVSDQIRPQQLAIRTKAIAKILPWYHRPAAAKLVLMNDSTTGSTTGNSQNTDAASSNDLANITQSNQLSDWKIVDAADASAAKLSGAMAARFSASSNPQATGTATFNTHDALWHRSLKQEFQLHSINDTSSADLVDLLDVSNG